MPEISIPIYKVGRTTVLGFLLAIEDPWALAVSEKMPELVLLSTSTSLTCHATSYVDTTLGAGAICLSLVFICVAMLLVRSRIVRYLGHMCTISLLRWMCPETSEQIPVVKISLVKCSMSCFLGNQTSPFLFKQTVSCNTARKIKTDLPNVIRFIVVLTHRY